MKSSEEQYNQIMHDFETEQILGKNYLNRGGDVDEGHSYCFV